jgi:tetratricopeptide (TPR) repeat protein
LSTVRRAAVLLAFWTALSGLESAWAAASGPEDHAEPAWWLGRAEQYARAIADPEQQRAAWMGLAAFHGRHGNFDAAHAVARHVPSPDERRECLRYVVIRIARSGDFATARRFADTIDEPLARATALAWVARVQAEYHEFDAARETIRLIDDPGQLAWARHQLAYEAATAGRYAEALAEAERIAPASPEDRLLKEDLLLWIAEARATGQGEPAEPPADTPPDQARRLLGPLGYRDLSVRDLARLKREADRAASPSDETTARRRVAWIHLTQAGPAEARVALARAERGLADIASPADRAIQRAAIADLYLELDEPASAKRVLSNASLSPASFPSSGLGTGEESLFADYRIAALLVGVLARTEGPERAAALVQSDPTACQAAWWAAGAFCAWLGRPDVLLPLLDLPADPHRKFTLAMGAAQGLAGRP